MKLNFELETIKYIQLYYLQGMANKKIKLAFRDSEEFEFKACVGKFDTSTIEMPQKVTVEFICDDGLYRTETDLIRIEEDDEYSYFIFKMPKTLDYQQNRRGYRVLADYDCIYTVDTEDGIQSFDTSIYDISVGGVSLVMDNLVVSNEETSILIFMPECDIKSHMRFIRCELCDKQFRLSFEFTDLSDKCIEYLSKYCISKQLS